MNHQEDSANVVLRYTQGSISRREFVRRATLLGLSMPAMVALIEACGTSSAISEMPASNQDLRIGFVKDEYVTTGPGGAVGQYPLNAGVYEPLVRLNPDYTYSPLLAKSFEQTGNNTFRFHLRPGVMWHDGSPLTADDVKFTLDRQGQAGSGPTGLGPNSTKVVDDQTVDVALTQANNRFVESLVHPVYGILKKGSQPGPTTPGTGPFKWGEYVQQSHVKVVRNDSYWGVKAKPTSIQFDFVTDDNTRALALAAGQYDVAAEIARPSVASLSQHSNVMVVKAPVGAYTAFYVNIHGKAPYDIGADPAVRLALQTGIDREAAVRSIFGGLATVTQTMVPPSVLGSYASQVKGFNHDPQKAKSALDGAGWKQTSNGIRAKNNRPLQLTLVNGFPDASSNAGVSEFVQASLRDIGIDITIKSEADGNSYGAAQGAGEGDLFVETGNQNDADPTFLASGIFDSKIGFPGYQIFAPGASVDTLITSALNATSDDQARMYVAMAMHQIVDVSMVLVELAGIFRIFGTRSNIRGLVAHPSDVNQSWATIYRVM